MLTGEPREGLSRREREVAELVAGGLTDREIGSRLFISIRTVETHVQRIRDKLGFDRRTQIASWVTARRHGAVAEPPDTERPPPAPPHNLPALITSFVGREHDLGVVRRLLDRDRLVTIAGPGGCGKTRLALEVAGRLLPRFPDGVWLIELGSVGDPETVPRAIAAAVGVSEREGATPLDAIAAKFATRRRRGTLVVLDNCEHLAEACAETVTRLLGASEALRFLCTSREPLHVPGEATWRIGPLSLPAPDVAPLPDTLVRSDAVRLFVDRVGLSDPAFSLDTASAPRVADLCARLDGIPLALELAAARFGLMSFARVLDHMEMSSGFPRVHGTPDRQRTMTSAIDWSYELLDETERRALRRLSVFRGTFTLEAAAAVSGEPPERAEGETLVTLASLVDRSLLQLVAPRRERYRCLEVIRRYALRRLAESGELDAVRDRHHAYHLGLAERAAPELTGPAQAGWLERLAEDHDDLRAALEHGRAGGVEQRRRFAVALYRFWYIRGHLSEGRSWAEAALAGGGEDAAAPLRARVLSVAASLAWQQGDLERARAWYEECLAAWRLLGDARGVQYSLGNLGLVAWAQGDWPAARGLYEESLALARANGDEREVGIVLINLGLLDAHTGDQRAGQASLREALAIMRAGGEPALAAAALANLGALALQQDDDAEASAQYEESLRIQRSLGARDSLSDCFVGLAAIAARQGRRERAVRLVGAAAGIRESIGAVPDPWSHRLLPPWLERAPEGLDASDARAWDDGRQLSAAEAIALALNETGA